MTPKEQADRIFDFLYQEEVCTSAHPEGGHRKIKRIGLYFCDEAIASIMSQIYPATIEPRVKGCLDWWHDVRTEIQANEKYVPKYPPVEEVPF